MIRRFFSMIFSLLVLAVVVFVGTGMWVVSDGVTDVGLHADVALVPGHGRLISGMPSPVLKERLDHAAHLYQQEAFPLIVVSGAANAEGDDEAAIMAQYLEAQDVPASSIIQDNQGTSIGATAHNMADIMNQRNMSSVMLITDYYLMTRTKKAIKAAGVVVVEHSHTGTLRQEDVPFIAQEVVTLYQNWYNLYARSWVELGLKEAKIGYAYATESLKSAKEKTSKSIDNLAK